MHVYERILIIGKKYWIKYAFINPSLIIEKKTNKKFEKDQKWIQKKEEL